MFTIFKLKCGSAVQSFSGLNSAIDRARHLIYGWPGAKKKKKNGGHLCLINIRCASVEEKKERRSSNGGKSRAKGTIKLGEKVVKVLETRNLSVVPCMSLFQFCCACDFLATHAHALVTSLLLVRMRPKLKKKLSPSVLHAQNGISGCMERRSLSTQIIRRWKPSSKSLLRKPRNVCSVSCSGCSATRSTSSIAKEPLWC